MSRTLLEVARENGIALRQGGARTDVLNEKISGKLRVEDFLKRIQELTGRKDTSLVIYKSIADLNKRGTIIQFDPN